MANNTDLFDTYFRRADLDGDGQISGAEAVGFFQGSSLPQQVLAQVPFFSLFFRLHNLERLRFFWDWLLRNVDFHTELSIGYDRERCNLDQVI